MTFRNISLSVVFTLMCAACTSLMADLWFHAGLAGGVFGAIVGLFGAVASMRNPSGIKVVNAGGLPLMVRRPVWPFVVAKTVLFAGICAFMLSATANNVGLEAYSLLASLVGAAMGVTIAMGSRLRSVYDLF